MGRARDRARLLQRYLLDHVRADRATRLDGTAREDDGPAPYAPDELLRRLAVGGVDVPGQIGFGEAHAGWGLRLTGGAGFGAEAEVRHDDTKVLGAGASAEGSIRGAGAHATLLGIGRLPYSSRPVVFTALQGTCWEAELSVSVQAAAGLPDVELRGPEELAFAAVLDAHASASLKVSGEYMSLRDDRPGWFDSLLDEELTARFDLALGRDVRLRELRDWLETRLGRPSLPRRALRALVDAPVDPDELAPRFDEVVLAPGEDPTVYLGHVRELAVWRARLATLREQAAARPGPLAPRCRLRVWGMKGGFQASFGVRAALQVPKAGGRLEVEVAPELSKARTDVLFECDTADGMRMSQHSVLHYTRAGIGGSYVASLRAAGKGGAREREGFRGHNTMIYHGVVVFWWPRGRGQSGVILPRSGSARGMSVDVARLRSTIAALEATPGDHTACAGLARVLHVKDEDLAALLRTPGLSELCGSADAEIAQALLLEASFEGPRGVDVPASAVAEDGSLKVAGLDDYAQYLAPDGGRRLGRRLQMLRVRLRLDDLHDSTARFKLGLPAWAPTPFTAAFELERLRHAGTRATIDLLGMGFGDLEGVEPFEDHPARVPPLTLFHQ